MQNQKKLVVFNVGDQITVRNAASFVGVIAGDSGEIISITENGVKFVVNKDGESIINQTSNPSFTLIEG